MDKWIANTQACDILLGLGAGIALAAGQDNLGVWAVIGQTDQNQDP